EDEELKSIFTTNYLDLFRNMILGILYRDTSILTNILKEVKNKGNYEIEFHTYNVLGDICFDNSKYYKAVNYYLTALDLLYRLARKIPDKGLQVSFVNKNRAAVILNKLRKVIFVVKGNELLYSEHTEYTENIKLEDYFNIKKIVDLFSEDIYSIEYNENS